MLYFSLQPHDEGLMEDLVYKTKTYADSILFWLVLLQFVVIVFLLLKIRRHNKKSREFSNISKSQFKKAQSSKIDMNNLMNSINAARPLYKQLSRVCHPDRFIDPEKNLIAQQIFQEISKHKRDYNQLNLLKTRAEKELNINLN